MNRFQSLLQPPQAKTDDPLRRPDAPPDLLNAPSELYHENSKLRANDAGLYRWIGFFNSSPHVRKIIARPVTYSHYQSVELPPVVGMAEEPLARTISGRRSARAFDYRSMPINELSRLLMLGGGITGAHHDSDGTVWQLRAAPSGGALYPIDLYCLALRIGGLAAGLYAYNPQAHSLALVVEGDFAAELATLSYGDPDATPPAAAIIMSASFQRCKVKYGERGYRFALLEAGHIAQNLLLAAEAAGLAAVPIGGFLDDRANALLQLDGVQEAVVYLVSVGNAPDAR
jgi:SagB-type dehydrogenase family enzyme